MCSGEKNWRTSGFHLAGIAGCPNAGEAESEEEHFGRQGYKSPGTWLLAGFWVGRGRLAKDAVTALSSDTGLSCISMGPNESYEPVLIIQFFKILFHIH